MSQILQSEKYYEIMIESVKNKLDRTLWRKLENKSN